jgi:hypothetical protein
VDTLARSGRHTPAKVALETSSKQTSGATELAPRARPARREHAPIVVGAVSFCIALAVIGVLLGSWALLSRREAPSPVPSASPGAR